MLVWTSASSKSLANCDVRAEIFGVLNHTKASGARQPSTHCGSTNPSDKIRLSSGPPTLVHRLINLIEAGGRLNIICKVADFLSRSQSALKQCKFHKQQEGTQPPIWCMMPRAIATEVAVPPLALECNRQSPTSNVPISLSGMSSFYRSVMTGQLSRCLTLQVVPAVRTDKGFSDACDCGCPSWSALTAREDVGAVKSDCGLRF
jgi:hypothetical protein